MPCAVDNTQNSDDQTPVKTPLKDNKLSHKRSASENVRATRAWCYMRFARYVLASALPTPASTSLGSSLQMMLEVLMSETKKTSTPQFQVKKVASGRHACCAPSCLRACACQLNVFFGHGSMGRRHLRSRSRRFRASEPAKT